MVTPPSAIHRSCMLGLLVVVSFFLAPRDLNAGTLQQQTVTVTGRWQYTDHAVTPSGVAATATNKAIRRALVEVQTAPLPEQNPTWQTVASTRTDNGGNFQTSVSNVAVGQERIRTRVCMSGPETSLLRVQVPGATEPTCYIGAAVVAQAVHDFGTQLTPDTEFAGAANIFDTILEAYDYIVAVGGVPAHSLTVNWNVGYAAGCGSCYLPGQYTVNLSGAAPNADHWDDAVIAHEFGHWVMEVYAAVIPDTEFGHGNCLEGTIHPNLEYSEGWASFFGSASRSASIDSIIRMWASHYIDTPGLIGSTGFIRNDDLETTTFFDSSTGRGTFCEWQVAGALWDVLDSGEVPPSSFGGAAQTDAVQAPFSSIFTAVRTQYNGHYPYNIVEWWYGWTNTLGNRSGGSQGSLGLEQAMLTMLGSWDNLDAVAFADNAHGHKIDVGVVFLLTWGATPLDIDSHLWLSGGQPIPCPVESNGQPHAVPVRQPRPGRRR